MSEVRQRPRLVLVKHLFTLWLAATAAACCFVMLLNYFTVRSLIVPISPVCLSVSPWRLGDLTCQSFSCRALSFASVRTATLESSARSSTPATTDRVATTAPVLIVDRGLKDATSPAPAPQVCVCVCALWQLSLSGKILTLLNWLSYFRAVSWCCGRLNVRGDHWLFVTSHQAVVQTSPVSAANEEQHPE